MHSYQMELAVRQRNEERLREAEAARRAREVAADRRSPFTFALEIAFAFARIGHLPAVSDHVSAGREGGRRATA
jgi:hypothetical protein